MHYRSWAYFKPKPHQLLDQWARLRKQAQLIKLSTPARLRLEWMIFYYTIGQQNVTLTAQHFNISRPTLYHWLKRFQHNSSLKMLEDRLKVNQRHRSWQPDPLILKRMIKLRKEFSCCLGKEKLALIYTQRYGQVISSWQFQRTIQTFKLYRDRKLKAYRHNDAKKERISFKLRQQASLLWQLDTIVLHWFGQKRYILTALEHTTKLAYARVYSSHSSWTARDFLLRLYYLVDGSVPAVLTDNGSEFAKYFNQACQQLTIQRYYSKPRTPKDNPENERFNRTLKEEWLNNGHWYRELRQMNQSLTDWLNHYNLERPHYSLQLKTPLAIAQQHPLLSRMISSYTSAFLVVKYLLY